MVESALTRVILGVGVFDAHAAVIDYSSHALFLRAVAAEPGGASYPDPSSRPR
jgi:hypothetical protein